MSLDQNSIQKTIKFHFHPFQQEKNLHAIEKSENNTKRKYLSGVSSGLKTDGHGERMTEKCIKSFMNQANSGDILLYPDLHGIKESEDIGILTKAEILENGDWYTEYRLYDESDNIGSYKQEKINDVWKQVCGLPPYKRKRQKGFSIEGIIPENSGIIKNGMGDNAIDGVELDGVVLVPRPAYQDSMATAVYKALGETTPHRRESLQRTLREQVQDREIQDKYYKYKWEYSDALDKVIEQIMQKKNNNKRDELEIALNEYRDLMINLILSSEDIFKEDEDKLILDITKGDSPYTTQDCSSKIELYKSLLNNIKQFRKQMEAM
jgi:hypothetical protein